MLLDVGPRYFRRAQFRASNCVDACFRIFSLLRQLRAIPMCAFQCPSNHRRIGDTAAGKRLTRADRKSRSAQMSHAANSRYTAYAAAFRRIRRIGLLTQRNLRAALSRQYPLPVPPVHCRLPPTCDGTQARAIGESGATPALRGSGLSRYHFWPAHTCPTPYALQPGNKSLQLPGFGKTVNYLRPQKSDQQRDTNRGEAQSR